jgi:hypothetical protein
MRVHAAAAQTTAAEKGTAGSVLFFVEIRQAFTGQGVTFVAAC